MALILKGGAVFLHIPKTGGNWVTMALRESGLVEGSLGHKHAGPDRLLSSVDARTGKMISYFRLRKLSGLLDPKPFMFCFVRHPLNWYESWFKYMTQPARNWCKWGDEKDLFNWHPNAVLNDCGSDDFNQFVRNVNTKRPGYVTELYGGYTAPQVDFVGKQETLREDLVKVLKQLNLGFDEEFVMNYQEFGVSVRPHQEFEWDPKLKKETLALERVALLRYGYPTE